MKKRSLTILGLGLFLTAFGFLVKSIEFDATHLQRLSPMVSIAQADTSDATHLQRLSPMVSIAQADTSDATHLQRLSPMTLAKVRIYPAQLQETLAGYGPAKRLLDGGKCLAGDIAPKMYYSVSATEDIDDLLTWIHPKRMVGPKRLLDKCVAQGDLFAWIHPKRMA
jgi:hypothetical protein